MILISTLIVVVSSLPGRGADEIGNQEQSVDRLVFAHFMVSSPN